MSLCDWDQMNEKRGGRNKSVNQHNSIFIRLSQSTEANVEMESASVERLRIYEDVAQYLC